MKNPYYFLEKESKKAIDYAVKTKSIVVTCIDGFRTDEEALRLRDLLWYARDRGVVVHFVPKNI